MLDPGNSRNMFENCLMKVDAGTKLLFAASVALVSPCATCCLPSPSRRPRAQLDAPPTSDQESIRRENLQPLPHSSRPTVTQSCATQKFLLVTFAYFYVEFFVSFSFFIFLLTIDWQVLGWNSCESLLTCWECQPDINEKLCGMKRSDKLWQNDWQIGALWLPQTMTNSQIMNCSVRRVEKAKINSTVSGLDVSAECI